MSDDLKLVILAVFDHLQFSACFVDFDINKILEKLSFCNVCDFVNKIPKVDHLGDSNPF